MRVPCDVKNADFDVESREGAISEFLPDTCKIVRKSTQLNLS